MPLDNRQFPTHEPMSAIMKGHSIAALAWLALMMLAGCAHPVPYYSPPPPPPPPSVQIRQQGYRDGAMAAQHDIRDGEPLNVARHALFRNPPVPLAVVEDYRRRFRDGYDQVLRHGPPPGN